MIGSVLAHYEIEALLGAGGMGVVYRAYYQKLRRQVAIKFLGDSTEIETRARLFREARAASALNHPNICTIYEVGEAEGRTYIVMEYVQGTLLSTLIPPGGLAPEAFSRYSLQIADAVKHAHANNVVHRDLKSGNIIVTSDGRAKVLDFGLANRMPGLGDDRATQSASITTSPQPVAGTLAYMPPEVLDGAPADFKGDVWSLGVLLYEMAAGEHPFKGARGLQLIAAIVGDRPIPPLRTGIHTAQKSVVERCLERDPKWRFEHAGVVHAALEGAATRWRGRQVRRWLPLQRFSSRPSRREQRTGSGRSRAGPRRPPRAAAARWCRLQPRLDAPSPSSDSRTSRGVLQRRGCRRRCRRC